MTGIASGGLAIFLLFHVANLLLVFCGRSVLRLYALEPDEYRESDAHKEQVAAHNYDDEYINLLVVHCASILPIHANRVCYRVYLSWL